MPRKNQGYPESHYQGHISLENNEIISEILFNNIKQAIKNNISPQDDLGIRIAPDGSIWVCINGIAFLRFSPHKDGKMSKE